ncbi:hypothetical protein [Cryptosporangium arvum]|uniref:hypothetical protein n=1 Tax=Cryptosporangium arvum TaxID=80871 RepID=UPI0004B292F2|nr:hypothetical protein [Cryptosporangium arvum]
MAGDDLSVNASKLGDWAFEMITNSGPAVMPAKMKLAPMAQTASDAFAGLKDAGPAGFFAEGKVMMAGIAKQQAAFERLLEDVRLGLTAIGQAANVCAYTYGTTDWESAEKLNLMGYAFADPTAKEPPGLPEGVGDTTMFDQRVTGEAAIGIDAEADAPGGQSIPVGGGMLTMYPDGSTRMVRTQTIDGIPRSVTTITAPSGTLVSTTTTTYTADKTGRVAPSLVVEVRPGGKTVDERGNTVRAQDVTTTTRTVTADDGKKTITKEIRVGEGKDAPTTKIEVKLDKPTYTAPVPEDRGPVQEAVESFPATTDVDWTKGYQRGTPSF